MPNTVYVADQSTRLVQQCKKIKFHFLSSMECSLSFGVSGEMQPAVTSEATWGNWGNRAPPDQYNFFCQVLHLYCHWLCVDIFVKEGGWYLLMNYQVNDNTLRYVSKTIENEYIMKASQDIKNIVVTR